MQNKEVDVIKFEDWVNKELGEDMVRELKTNCYINYGPIKYIFEHFFVSLYHPKFVKIVKMNLDLKQATEIDTDQRLTELKLKNKSLKAKMSEMKSMCEEVELDVKHQYEGYQNDLQASQANEAFLCGKITDNLLQNTFLTKARQYANKFRIAAKRLSLISDGRDAQMSNLTASESLMFDSRFGRQLESDADERSMRVCADKDDASRKLNKVYETLLLNFQQNQNNIRNDISRLQQLDLIECLNMLSRKLDTDQSQVAFNDFKSIVNDIMLVLYKNDPYNFSRIECTLNELRQSGNDVECLQLISKCSSSKEREYLRFIELCCRMQYHLRTKQKVLSKQRYFGHQLQDFLTQSYSKQDASMYHRFLRSHNKMRYSDQNLIELKKCLDELEHEMTDIKRSFLSVQAKHNKYKELQEIIVQRQLDLVNMINANKRLCSIHNNGNTGKHLLRNNFDNVLDLMHAIKTTNLKPPINQSNLTMSSLTMNESRSSMTMSRGNEICLGKDYENYRSGIFGSRPAPGSLAEAHKRSMGFLNKKSYLFSEILKHRPFKSNSFVIEQLYEMFNLMQRELKKMDSKLISSSLDMLSDSQSVVHLASQTKKLLDRCQDIDKNELKQYSIEMEEVIGKCAVTKEHTVKFEKLVDMWARQPGAYECHLENLTVNGRTLKHYYDMFQALLADPATRNKIQMTSCHLIDEILRKNRC